MLQAECTGKCIGETETGDLREGEKRYAEWVRKETYMDAKESM
jgi:hypothetical protein